MSAWWICVSNRDEKINHAKDWISLKTPKANPKKIWESKYFIRWLFAKLSFTFFIIYSFIIFILENKHCLFWWFNVLASKSLTKNFIFLILFFLFILYNLSLMFIHYELSNKLALILLKFLTNNLQKFSGSLFYSLSFWVCLNKFR